MIEEGESRDSLSAHMGLKEMINCKLKRYRTRISFLKSCRWSLRGKGQVDNLVCILREYNDSLYRLCSWEAQWQINRGLSSYTLRQNNDSVDLHLIADVVDKEAVDGNSPTVEGCRGLGKMARFKAEVITRRPENRWQLLDREVYDLPIGPGFWARPSDTREGEEVMREWQNLGSWTLARDTREGGAVFVEWQSYWDDGVRGGHEAQEQIHELGNFLCVPNRPISFRTLTCIGLFDDFRRRRYGVVFQLPNNLEELDLNDGKLDDFKPTSLKGLIRCANGIDEAHALGARFELARKLVNTVVVLHTCGWLHKNICPDNVLFFSTPPLAGHRLPPWETDITDPFIVGYGLSRKDDILEKHDREQLSRANLQRKLPMSRTKTEGLPKGDCVPSNPRIYNLVLTSIHDADENTEGNPVLNIYQHPDKVANPDSRFRHSYDVYSLGVVLLEIGLWRSLEDIDLTQAKDNHQLRRFILGNLVPKLRSRCGTIYCDVVRDCLKMRTNDNELVDEGQRRLAQSIADRLDSCVV